MADPTTPSIPPGAFRPRESVWDYPRPPDIKASERRVRIIVDGVTVAESTRAIRVLEQGHPPVWYLPPADVRTDLPETTSKQSACEFKGEASYFGIRGREPVRSSRDRNRDVAWTYLDPLPDYDAIRDYIAFYSDRVDEAWIDDERVEPQAGDFYGGWITAEIDGPFKGPPGTLDW